MSAKANGLTAHTFPKKFAKFLKRANVGVYPMGVTTNRQHKVPVRILFSTDSNDLARFQSLVFMPGHSQEKSALHNYVMRSRKHAHATLVSTVKQVQRAVDDTARGDREGRSPVSAAVVALRRAVRKQAFEGNSSFVVTLESGLALVQAATSFSRLGDSSSTAVTAEILQPASANSWRTGSGDGEQFMAVVRELALEVGGAEAISEYSQPASVGWADALRPEVDAMFDPVRIYQGLTAGFADGTHHVFGDRFTERALLVYADTRDQMEYHLRRVWHVSGYFEYQGFYSEETPFTDIAASLRGVEFSASVFLDPAQCVELSGFAAAAERIAEERGEKPPK